MSILTIKKALITVGIFYYMPEYRHLVQEFYWQTEDIPPELRRIHSFLNFWKTDIDAVIKDVIIWQPVEHDWRRIDWEYNA